MPAMTAQKLQLLRSIEHREVMIERFLDRATAYEDRGDRFAADIRLDTALRLERRNEHARTELAALT